jgi:hypothetical protein
MSSGKMGEYGMIESAGITTRENIVLLLDMDPDTTGRNTGPCCVSGTSGKLLPKCESIESGGLATCHARRRGRRSFLELLRSICVGEGFCICWNLVHDWKRGGWNVGSHFYIVDRIQCRR